MVEKLKDKYRNLFAPQIIYRGIDYFRNDKVINVYKNEKSEKYISKVEGSEFGVSYDVEIEIADDKINMSCSCPCIDNCKHEYATLLSIDEGEYENIKLYDIPKEKGINIEKFVNSIPEEKLKRYLIDSFKERKIINRDVFKKDFECYLPEKDRNYYYNTLFNNFQLGITDIDKFLDLAKLSLENEKYRNTFVISSAIIDALKDVGILSNDKLLNSYNLIEIFIRIAYRKGNKKLKLEIEQWIEKYEKKKYYNDIYLEDMIIRIKN